MKTEWQTEDFQTRSLQKQKHATRRNTLNVSVLSDSLTVKSDEHGEN